MDVYIVNCHRGIYHTVEPSVTHPKQFAIQLAQSNHEGISLVVHSMACLHNC